MPALHSLPSISAFSYLAAVIWQLLFAICYLLSAICYLPRDTTAKVGARFGASPRACHRLAESRSDPVRPSQPNGTTNNPGPAARAVSSSNEKTARAPFSPDTHG